MSIQFQFTFLKLLLILSAAATTTLSINFTHLLDPYSDLSDFKDLISQTQIESDLTRRTSLTLLAVPNSYLRTLTRRPSPSTLADVLRYHVLLEYLSLTDLHNFPPDGKLVTTLFQTTGRAYSDSGTVNVTADPVSGEITVNSPTSNATILSQIETLPYNVSILTLNSLLIPNNLDLMASEARPPPVVNITGALIGGHNFNVAASMLTASGVVSEFEGDEGGAGITLFVPTDEAFANLPSSVKFQSLPADRKAVVLRFHVLHSYYPLGSLESIVNPVQPTLATEENGAGSFTLNISRVNGSVGIDTGVVQASIIQTVVDQNPVAIFGVSRVLLPREFFGRNPIEVEKPGGDDGGGMAAGSAQPPEVAQSPTVYGPPSRLSGSPELEIRSGAMRRTIEIGGVILGLWCILID